MEYSRKFSKVDPIKAKELVDKLIQKFDLERGDTINIVNCMPNSVEELRVFFSKSRKRLILSSQLEELLKLLDNYR